MYKGSESSLQYRSMRRANQSSGAGSAMSARGVGDDLVEMAENWISYSSRATYPMCGVHTTVPIAKNE